MKIELEVCDDDMDRVVRKWVLDHIDMIEQGEEQFWTHEDDVKYNKKLCKALRRVADYIRSE